MSCGCEDDKKPFTEYSLVKAGKSVIKHFTDPTYNAFSSQEVKAERIKICENCENREEFLGKKRCKICLCFIDAKASLIDQDCPHPEGNKWQKDQ
jgi:hypothetical protein